MKKYAVYPGRIQSKNDGERHFISFGKLCQLHRVEPHECVDMSRQESRRGLHPSEVEKLIPLHVSPAGSYPSKRLQEPRP